MEHIRVKVMPELVDDKVKVPVLIDNEKQGFIGSIIEVDEDTPFNITVDIPNAEEKEVEVEFDSTTIDNPLEVVINVA